MACLRSIKPAWGSSAASLLSLPAFLMLFYLVIPFLEWSDKELERVEFVGLIQAFTTVFICSILLSFSKRFHHPLSIAFGVVNSLGLLSALFVILSEYLLGNYWWSLR